MRRQPSGAGWLLVAAITPALLLAAIAWSTRGGSLWLVLSLCALGWSTLTSLPAVLALALALSIWGLLVLQLCRAALSGRRAARAAERHAVAPSPSVQSAARALGIRRLVVADLPERMAFCVGLVRPTVVISTALVRSLEAAPLSAVLAHEAAHARSWDPLRQTLVHAGAGALWFAPAAREAAEHQHLRRELAADRHASSRCGRRALAEALLALHAMPPGAFGPAVAGAASALGARVDALASGGTVPLLDVDRTARRRSIVGLAAVALLLLAAIAGPRLGPEAMVAMPVSTLGTVDMAVACALRGAAIVLGAMMLRRWTADPARGR